MLVHIGCNSVGLFVFVKKVAQSFSVVSSKEKLIGYHMQGYAVQCTSLS